MNRNRARIAGEIVVPDGVHEALAAEHLARVARQVEEEVELPRREVDGAALVLNRPLAAADAEVAEAQAIAVAVAPVRRRTALTRATSSRGLNGFAT